MSGHRHLIDLTREEWIRAMGIGDAEVPELVVLEGSWWREDRTAWRTAGLGDVRELAFPDIFHGWVGDVPVVYSCVYGAPRAGELTHLFSLLGARTVVIGTCGALQQDMSTGDIVVPRRAVPGEGVAAAYGYSQVVGADPELTEVVTDGLVERGFTTFDSLHLTWGSIFAQNDKMISEWRELGYGSVDMEAATVFAVARFFEARAAAMLVVWDLLDRDRSFLDPLAAIERERLDAANAAVFEVALDLAGR